MSARFFSLLILPPLALLLLILLPGCYTLKQGFTMLGYLRRAVPLEDLEGPDADAEDRLFAERVRDIRRFAVTELGLKETANYTRYVRLERDYLAAVVSASAEDSFSRHEWWFPVVGKVPYKGFFNPDDAKKETEKLKKKKLDVWVRPVDAFSTLGWFKDPLYSYMKNYPVHALADLIIHELFHATLFLKNETQFNEELAEFIGEKGARLYIEKKYGLDSEEYRAIDRSKADSAAFVSFIRELSGRLEILYAENTAADASRRDFVLSEKDRIIKEEQKRFEDSYNDIFQSSGYRFFSSLPVNNAYLELYRLYYSVDNYLEDYFVRSGLDLFRFIAAAKTVKPSRGPDDPRLLFQKALGL